MCIRIKQTEILSHNLGFTSGCPPPYGEYLTSKINIRIINIAAKLIRRSHGPTAKTAACRAFSANAV